MPQANKRWFDSECTRPDRCPKCGDSQHREGFRCQTSKHQCKICHKFGHFSSLYYKKTDGLHNHNRSLCSPRAHQLKIGSIFTQDFFEQKVRSLLKWRRFILLAVTGAIYTSWDQFYSTTASSHKLDYKLTPHKKRTKFLRARIDTCANVNLMPISVYWLLYKDPDCQKLAPSNKSKVKAFSTEKIQIVGSCDLFVLCLDTKCLMEVTFQVTSHEGSVIVSCATRFGFRLDTAPWDLDVLPDSGSLIYSKADPPVKQKYKKSVPVSRLSDSVHWWEVQSPPVSRVQETEVIQCVNQKVQAKCKQQHCQVPVHTVFDDRNCQETKDIHMWPVKPAMDMQSNKPAASLQQRVPQEDDKNCQFNMKQNYQEGQDGPVCSDKQCQENVYMWQVQPA